MARKRVALENTLGNMSDFLGERYEIVQLDPTTQTGIELKNCDAIVIGGTDDNLMGMTTIKTEAPVINARGMSPQQVLSRLDQTFDKI